MASEPTPRWPKCQLCDEMEEASPAVAKLLGLVSMSVGGSKVQKWMLLCPNHYSGGQFFILTEVPDFLSKRDVK